MLTGFKLRATQVWGFLTLILGSLLSVVQFFALISPRKLDLRIFSLMVGLAAYLIFIGRRSIRLARASEVGGVELQLSDTLRTLGHWFNDKIGKFQDQLARESPTRTTVLVVLGFMHVVAGLAAFLFVGAVIFATVAYLGFGPAALPVLLFCPLGAVFGVGMMVRPNGGARHAAALWDIVLGILFLLATLLARGFHIEGLILAMIFLGMAGAAKIPDPKT